MSTESGPGETLERIDRALHGLPWFPIAKKEFVDTVRSRSLWVLSVFFVGVFALPPALALYFDFGRTFQSDTGQQLTSDVLVTVMSNFVSVIVPLIAIAVAYAAVSGERQSGSLKLLLSLPFSRLDVIVGKLVGRFFVVALPLVASLLLTIALLVPSSIRIKAEGYLVFTALTAVLALVFLGFAIGASAATRTTRRSMFVTVGVFVGFFLLWNSIAQGVGQLLVDHAGVESATRIEAELLVKLFNPTQAYQTLVTSLSGGAEPFAARASMFTGLRRAFVAQQLQGSMPWYLSDAMAALSLAVWLIVPLVAGYVAFEDTDL